MAGQLASLPLSIQLDDNARPLDGALLYLYAAGTSTPAVFYEDFATTVVLSWPLVADIAGRIPMFWVVDGSYRVRLTDNAGNEIFDINSITAVGPSAGATGGGTSVSSDQLFQTGDPIWLPISGTRTGWVRGNALTIGSSSSGASERANADCQSLFEYFWNTFSDSLCPVTTGRGSSALNDWNANKRIATLDMRGIGAYGLDTMGNSAAGRITAATSAAVFLGAQSNAITVAQGNLPNVNFNANGLTADINHTHFAGSYQVTSHNHAAGTFAVGTGLTNATNVTRGLSFGTDNAVSGGGARTELSSAAFSSDTVSLTSGAVSGTSGTASPTVFGISGSGTGAIAVTGTVASGGSGTALTVPSLAPGRAGTWFFKL